VLGYHCYRWMGRVQKGQVFYGWWIVTVSFGVVLVSTGIRFAFGPSLIPMTDDLGFSRTTLSTIAALSMVVYGTGMVFAGYTVSHTFGTEYCRRSFSKLTGLGYHPYGVNQDPRLPVTPQ